MFQFLTTLPLRLVSLVQKFGLLRCQVYKHLQAVRSYSCLIVVLVIPVLIYTLILVARLGSRWAMARQLAISTTAAPVLLQEAELATP